MKTPALTMRTATRGFTLIELLVVISIIAVLAGMLLPVLGIAKTKAKVAKAKTELSNLMTAINQYEADYHRYPASDLARASLTSEGPPPLYPDFTFGTYYRRNDGSGYRLMNGTGRQACFRVDNGSRRINYETSNAEVMSALCDIVEFRNGELSPNKREHVLNPKKNPYLELTLVDTPKQPNNPARAGLGWDGVYRDPWGNPYVISLDLNYDGRCRDAHYRRASVSADASGRGINGLSRGDTRDPDSFEANKPIMIWSFGPDGGANNTDQKANQGFNKDNVISWQ
jgi:prepilin-type N-terminal cleavage/methylation domain-containing protein